MTYCCGRLKPMERRLDGIVRTRTQSADGAGTMGFRVVVMAGLATLYLAGCLAALALILSMWSPSL